jgi:hypothetical protein
MLASTETAIQKGGDFISQSHQYVKMDIFRTHDYSLRRETVYKTTCKDFLARVLLEP